MSFFRRVPAGMRQVARHVLRRELRTAADGRGQIPARGQIADLVENAERHVQGKGREIRR